MRLLALEILRHHLGDSSFGRGENKRTGNHDKDLTIVHRHAT